MEKKIMVLLSILLCMPLVTADVTINQTIVTNESVEYTENIYSEGNITSTHNVYGNLSKLIINGIDIDAYDSLYYNQLENYVITNENSWEEDKVGIRSETVAYLIERAMKILSGNTRYYGKNEERIAKALYSVFMPRWEIFDLFRNFNFRLKVIEHHLAEEDPERFCLSALSVAYNEGLKELTCMGKTYNLAYDGDAIIITPIIEGKVTNYTK